MSADNTHITIFDSLTDYMAVKVAKVNKDLAEHTLRAERGEEWFGIDGGGPEIADAVWKGWPKGLKKTRELIDKIRPHLPLARDRRRKREFADSGDDLDIQRVYSGNLDTAWTRTRRRMSSGSATITLKTSITGSCGKSTAALFYKGAVAAIVTDALEAAGYRVAVVGYDHTESAFPNGPKLNNYAEIPFKAASEPLDLERLIACTGLAGFLRWYGFKQVMSIPSKVGTGLGCPVEAPHESQDHDGAHLINNVYSEEAAIKRATEILELFA